MLRYKNIKNLSELKLLFVDKHKKEEYFTDIIDILKIGKYHAIFSNVKKKGISALLLIKILISFKFIGVDNVYSFIENFWNKTVGFGKDAYYRLKNNPKINWRLFLFSVVKQTLLTLEQRKAITEQKISQVRAFIFDDSPLKKTGKKIEGVSKIYNHVIKKHILGFQLLVMGLYDGTMFIPVNFSLHREKGKNKKTPFGLKPKHYRKQFKKKRNTKTQGAKRKKELDISKIKSVAKMIKDAVKNNITADYILTDSWFTCWELVKTALENKMHYIGMFSKATTKFTYNNKKLNYKEIRRLNRKNIKLNRRFNLYYIQTVVEWNDRKVILYSTRNGKNGNWKVIISTDLSLNFIKTIEIYQIRWSIEVFFKESKQMLDLGKSQSEDFDAQIADTTITMIQYVFLALGNRIEKYESLGKLYENTKEAVVELKLHDRLIALLTAIIDIIGSLFKNADSEDLFTTIINDDTAFDKIRLLINPPEIFNKQVA